MWPGFVENYISVTSWGLIQRFRWYFLRMDRVMCWAWNLARVWAKIHIWAPRTPYPIPEMSNLSLCLAEARTLVPSNTKHRLSAKAIRSCGRCGWRAWVYPWFFALEILKINPLFIPCNYTMQKRLPFVPSEQNAARVFAPFYLSIA